MADPITIALAGIAAAGGFAASKAVGASAESATNSPASAAPEAVAPAPQAAAPAPRKPMSSGVGRGTQPSFIGASAAPEQRSFGQKTLVGQ